MNKICILGVWFGTFYNNMPLWLKSCEYNNTIDFMVFTDQDLNKKYRVPHNVKVVSFTLNEMKKRATERLGFQASLERPYKCCDYKVIYGVIFEDLIKDYDYWGHCDFDLVFGDLRYFFDKYQLYKYDKFLALGHLSLYRNKPEINARYKKGGARDAYDIVYSNDKNYYFDEFPGIAAIYLRNKFPFFSQRIFADISSIGKRFRLSEDYILDRKVKNYKKQIFYWQDGKVYREYFNNGYGKKEEFIYIHFKKRSGMEIYFDVNRVSSFYITDKGFFKKETEVTLNDIQKLNSSDGLKDIYRLLKHRAIKKLRVIKRSIFKQYMIKREKQYLWQKETHQ